MHIASNDADEASFDIALTGRALAPSADDDGNTISNEAEMNLYGLGFDPLVPNTTTVALLRDNGLSSGTGLQTVALHRPVLEKNGVTGHFHLNIGVETSPDRNTWTPLLNFTPTYNPTTGRIDLEFTPSPASTQFFRVLGAKPRARCGKAVTSLSRERGAQFRDVLETQRDASPHRPRAEWPKNRA